MTNTEDSGVTGAGCNGTKIMSETEYRPTVIDGSVACIFSILKGSVLHELGTDIGVGACLICAPICLKHHQRTTKHSSHKHSPIELSNIRNHLTGIQLENNGGGKETLTDIECDLNSPGKRFGFVTALDG
jgi:hypothetical protein